MAVFGFAYVPWSKPHQRLLPQEALPKTEQRVELFLGAVESFTTRRLPAHRPRPLRARVGRARAGAGRRLPVPELPGLHRPSGGRHRRVRDDVHLGHRRRVRPERAQAQGLGRAGGEPAPIPVERGASMSEDDVHAALRDQPGDVPAPARPARDRREVRRAGARRDSRRRCAPAWRARSRTGSSRSTATSCR